MLGFSDVVILIHTATHIRRPASEPQDLSQTEQPVPPPDILCQQPNTIGG